MLKTAPLFLFVVLVASIQLDAFQNSNAMPQTSVGLQSALDALTVIEKSNPGSAELYNTFRLRVLARSGRLEEAVSLAEKESDDSFRALSFAILSSQFAIVKKFEEATSLLEGAENLSKTIENSNINNQQKAQYYSSLATSHFLLGNIKRFEEIKAKQKSSLGVVSQVVEALIHQQSFDAATGLLENKQLRKKWESKIDLAQAALAARGDKDAGAKAYLSIALKQADRRLNPKPDWPSANNQLAIQSIYWLASNGYAKKLAAAWPKFPFSDSFANSSILIAARVLAQEGKEGAVRGVELLKAFNMMDMGAEIFEAAGLLKEYDQAELDYWTTRINEPQATIVELKQAAVSLARLGGTEPLRSLAEKHPELGFVLARNLAIAGDAEGAIGMAKELVKTKKFRETTFSPVADLESIKAYHAQALFRSGKTEQAIALFNECLAACEDLNLKRGSGHHGQITFDRIFARRIDCGDLDGAISFVMHPDHKDWELTGSITTFRTLAYGLAKANRIEEATSFATRKRQKIEWDRVTRQIVGKGLLDGKHWAEAIPLADPNLFRSRRTPNLFTRPRLEIVEDVDRWKYRNEVDSNSSGFELLSHVARNFAKQHLLEFIEATKGNGFLTLAQLMRQENRDKELLVVIESMAAEFTPETTKMNLVTQAMYVLAQLDQFSQAFDIGKKYIEAVPGIQRGRRREGEGIRNRSQQNWDDEAARLFFQQWNLVVEGANRKEEPVKIPTPFAKIRTSVEQGTATYRLQSFLRPQVPVPVSGLRIEIARLQGDISKPYRRGSNPR